jgi:hypothetical protein
VGLLILRNRVTERIRLGPGKFIPPDYKNLVARLDCLMLLRGGSTFMASLEQAATSGSWPLKVAPTELNLAAEFLAISMVMLKGSAGSFELKSWLFAINSILDASNMLALKGMALATLQAKTTSSDVSMMCQRHNLPDGELVSGPGLAVAAPTSLASFASFGGGSLGGGGSRVSQGGGSTIGPHDSISQVGRQASNRGGRGTADRVGGGSRGGRGGRVTTLCGRCGSEGHRYTTCVKDNSDWDPARPFDLLNRMARGEYVFP